MSDEEHYMRIPHIANPAPEFTLEQIQYLRQFGWGKGANQPRQEWSGAMKLIDAVSLREGFQKTVDECEANLAAHSSDEWAEWRSSLEGAVMCTVWLALSATLSDVIAMIDETPPAKLPVECRLAWTETGKDDSE